MTQLKTCSVNLEQIYRMNPQLFTAEGLDGLSLGSSKETYSEKIAILHGAVGVLWKASDGPKSRLGRSIA